MQTDDAVIVMFGAAPAYIVFVPKFIFKKLFPAPPKLSARPFPLHPENDAGLCYTLRTYVDIPNPVISSPQNEDRVADPRQFNTSCGSLSRGFRKI